MPEVKDEQAREKSLLDPVPLDGWADPGPGDCGDYYGGGLRNNERGTPPMRFFFAPRNRMMVRPSPFSD